MASRYEPALITFLGTSFTHRFPLGDCKCDQCQEARQGSFKRRNTAVLLDADRKLFLLDCGPGMADSLRDLIPARVFITHTHPDHFGGIANLKPSTRINLLHGETVGRCDFQPFAVQHAKDAMTVGYEITVPGGMTIIFAPDFYRINNEGILDEADLAILCGSSLMEDIKYGEGVGHQSMLNSIRMCNKHKVKNIIFTHVGHIGMRHLDLEFKLKELAKKEGYGGEVVLAYDGYQVRLSKKGLALEKSFTEIFKGCEDIDPAEKHVLAKAWMDWQPDDEIDILKAVDRHPETDMPNKGSDGGGGAGLLPTNGELRAEGHSNVGQDSIMELSQDLVPSVGEYHMIIGIPFDEDRSPATVKSDWKKLSRMYHILKNDASVQSEWQEQNITIDDLVAAGEQIIERMLAMKAALWHSDSMGDPTKELFDLICEHLKVKGKSVPIEKAFSDEALDEMLSVIRSPV